MALVITDPDFFPPYIVNELASPVRGEMVHTARKALKRGPGGTSLTDRNARHAAWNRDTDHIRSLAHAVVIVRGFMIRDEFGPEGIPLSAEQRASFDYSESAAVIANVLDWWNRTAEDPGYGDEARSREFAAWRYIATAHGLSYFPGADA